MSINDNQLTARTEFAAAINQICNERGISPQIVIDSIKAALAASFAKDYPDEAQKVADSELDIVVELDSGTGEFKLFKGHQGDKPKDLVDITPPGFGRIAAQTAKQVVLQKIREAERAATISDYRDKVGQIIPGMVLRHDNANIIIDLGRGQATLLPDGQVKGEFYRLNARFSFLIEKIELLPRGETIIVSRSHPDLVKGLFAREVPEVGSGVVEIKAIAREAGSRVKVAVLSHQEGVDPVGSCVGQKGVRVQAIINELNGEKIDIVPFSENLEEFVKAALSPADNLEVAIKDKRDTIITAPHDQLSLAIGRGGQNVRLAAKLTGLTISIKSNQTDPGIVVTGNEEYEIDQLGLPDKTRAKLIKAKLIRIDELINHPELLEAVDLTAKAKKEIAAKLTAYQSPSKT